MSTAACVLPWVAGITRGGVITATITRRGVTTAATAIAMIGEVARHG